MREYALRVIILDYPNYVDKISCNNTAEMINICKQILDDDTNIRIIGCEFFQLPSEEGIDRNDIFFVARKLHLEAFRSVGERERYTLITI